jgi:hypothetical protein
MDVTGIIVAGVLFFFSIPLVAAISIFGGAFIGGAVAPRNDESAGIAAGGLIGWVVALVWAVFAIINVIIRIVELIQALTGSAA